MGCFAQTPGFAQRNFIQGCSVGSLAARSAYNPARIPRWLLKFERTGMTTYLSDVGGEIEGIFYVPAIADVSISDMVIDLERFTMPKGSCTVHVSPSARDEFFRDLEELGRARVTVSSWDGYTKRDIITADMQAEEWAYDGELTSFRLTEEFTHDPTVPERIVNYGTGQGFSKAELADGARFRAYTWVWGDARQVPAFALIKIDDSTTRWMIIGHNIPGGDPPAVSGGDGSPARYRDRTNATYIGVDLTGSPSFPFYDVVGSWNVKTAGDFLQRLIEGHSTFGDDERDGPGLEALYRSLSQFSAAGYKDQDGPFFNFISGRLQTEWMFVLWQQAGKLTGCYIDPTADPARTLVMGVHLLQLQDPITEDTKYNAFKTRYKFRQKPDQGWYGVEQIDASNSPYLAWMQERWGFRAFGNPVEFPRHIRSVDLADTEHQADAKVICQRYAQVFHRGERAPYLQLAEFADIALGTTVALVDPERGYDERPAKLIGRRWLTPELIVQTYRTIEPLGDQAEKPTKLADDGDGGGGGDPDCPDMFSGGLEGAGFTRTDNVTNAIPSVIGDTMEVSRTTIGAGYAEIEIKSTIDSDDWGSCTRLRIEVAWELELDSVAGVPIAVFQWDMPGAGDLVDSQVGVVGTRTGTLALDFTAPIHSATPNNFFRVWINGTMTGHAKARIIDYSLHPS